MPGLEPSVPGVLLDATALPIPLVRPRPPGRSADADGSGHARHRTGSTRRRARTTAHSVARTLFPLPVGVWVLLDVGLVLVGLHIGYWPFALGDPAFGWMIAEWVAAPVFAASFALAGLIFGLYEARVLPSRGKIFSRSVATTALAVTLSYTIVLLFMYAEVSRWLGVFVGAVYLGGGVPIRLVAHQMLARYPLGILIIGSGEFGRGLARDLRREPGHCYRVVGRVAAPGAPTGTTLDAQATASAVAIPLTQLPPAPPLSAHAQAPTTDPSLTLDDDTLCPLVGTLDELFTICHDHDVQEIVVEPAVSQDATVMNAALGCLSIGCHVTNTATFLEKVFGEVRPEDLTPNWFLFADIDVGRGGRSTIKRMADVALALIGAIVAAPLAAVIAVAIKLDSRGPVIYRQTRVGMNGRVFTMYKFRTMCDGAETGGAQWAAHRDARVTRVGRLLRSLRLDELPQLWNILAGQMSLVGPRPERPEFVAELARQIPYYNHRHLIMPGLTGWAQIHRGYGGTIADARKKLCLDLYYLKYQSFELDVAIIVRTIGTFFAGSR